MNWLFRASKNSYQPLSNKEAKCCSRSLRKQSETNWYKRAQKIYDLDNTYLDIGHSGYNEGKYGCNHLYYFFKNGSFRDTPETDRINNHGVWRTEGEIEGDFIYKGRVDTCKKVASITACGNCFSGNGFNQMNGSKEAFCEKMKHMCQNVIYQRFGNDIIIHEFNL